MTETTGIASFRTVAFDAPDLQAEAAFWTGLTGAVAVYEDLDWLTVRTPDGWQMAFQLAPDHQPPQWPSQSRPQQIHLDLQVPDLAAATASAVGLGATVLRENERWNTLADPAGHPFDLVGNDEVSGPSVWGVCFDVPDAHAAAVFWSSLLGAPIAFDAAEGAMLGGDHPLLFQPVEDYTAPDWPDPAKPQQGHLDLTLASGDLDAGEAAVVALGARVLPGGEETFRVFADPAGHPFCLVR